MKIVFSGIFALVLIMNVSLVCGMAEAFKNYKQTISFLDEIPNVWKGDNRAWKEIFDTLGLTAFQKAKL